MNEDDTFGVWLAWGEKIRSCRPDDPEIMIPMVFPLWGLALLAVAIHQAGTT